VQQQRETVRDNRKRFFRINVRKVFYIPYGGWQEIAACYKKVHKLLQNGYNSGLTKRKVLIIKEKIKLLGNRSAPAPATNFQIFSLFSMPYDNVSFTIFVGATQLATKKKTYLLLQMEASN
jgi:hypothetical protein